jgi:hypothetical protein
MPEAGLVAIRSSTLGQSLATILRQCSAWRQHLVLFYVLLLLCSPSSKVPKFQSSALSSKPFQMLLTRLLLSIPASGGALS